MSPILTPSAATGARTKLTPMVSAATDRLVTDSVLDEELRDVGLNSPFLADVLSAALAHERCGRHLYRSVQARTNNPVLAARYREFGDETERHVAVLDELVATLGGDSQYVSPVARVTESMGTRLLESTFLLAGSLDLMSAEQIMLDAVLLAETIDHANWVALAKIAEALPPGNLRDRFQASVAEVLADEEEHVTWAHDTRLRLLTLQTSSGVVASLAGHGEEVVAKIRSWFS